MIHQHQTVWDQADMFQKVVLLLHRNIISQDGLFLKQAELLELTKIQRITGTRHMIPDQALAARWLQRTLQPKDAPSVQVIVDKHTRKDSSKIKCKAPLV